jgi:phytoene synthase
MAEEKNSYNTSERTNLAIEKLMTQHDPILLFASKLLPPDKAADASALYAWCRRLDEICDGEENNVLASSVAGSLEPVRDQLEVWQARFEALWSDQEPTTSANYPDNDDYLMDLALKSCIEKYQGEGNDANDSLLTRVPFDDMIQGMKSDAVEERRIQNMEELEVYAYQVAGTVGLMLLPLLLSDSKNGNNMTTRIATEEAREPAICLGKAIQLVNILRDATQDAKLGRIYLPQDMLRAEGVDDESIFAVGLDQSSSSQASTQPPKGYTTVVKKVSRRALELLAIAEKGKDTLPPPLGPLFVQIIVELYRDYLDELDCRGYDNLSSSSKSGDEDRVKISTLRKAKASLRAIVKVGRELFFGSGAVS